MTAKKYKGIAVFGAPGSGKTTIARLLVGEFPNSRYLEASQCVINTSFAMSEILPSKEADFIRLISEFKSGKKEISRKDARAMFVRLKKTYSPEIISKALIYIHKKRFFGKLLIIAGIRGRDNAFFLKKNGYLVVYLNTSGRHLSDRVSKRENFSKRFAEKERQIEERLFSTSGIESDADLSFNTVATGEKDIIAEIKAMISPVECRKCVNSTANPSVSIGKSGLCDVCERYVKNFDKNSLKKELKFLLSLRKSGKNKYDALVGISGGKDSTAMLYDVKRMGFSPLAFSLDAGYYPNHIFSRASEVARELDVDYEKIDVRKYMRPADRECFKKTADIYSENDSEALKKKFRKWYMEGRRHYSVKCGHKIPFIRTCQLCRRLIVRAYYGEAVRRGVSAVILGINEWAGLSQSSGSDKFVFSAIRRLKPFKNKPAVFMIHLPFLLQRNIRDTEKTLKKLGWKIPRGERLIESNSNSCLFARAAESKARRMLGFHPDSTRLAREVTVGFISKKQAHAALEKNHDYKYSVRQILRKAKLI